MRSLIAILVLVAVVSVALVAVSAHGAQASRMDVELSWDDGSAEDGVAPTEVLGLGVGFYAPATALTLTGIRVYMWDDGIPYPPDPQHPSTAPFTVWAYRTGTEGEPTLPANDGYVPLPWETPCPEDTWIDIVFPEPIDLSDEAYFPGHKFHVGLEWDSQDTLAIGLDLDPPFSGETWYSDSSGWVPVDSADAMIRAVVRDTSGTPVELESWGRVKVQYR
jgi:hypothetical protein